jgi:hypothetical protein
MHCNAYTGRCNDTDGLWGVFGAKRHFLSIGSCPRQNRFKRDLVLQPCNFGQIDEKTLLQDSI